jgi:alcohol dehydrogenase (cytochrome c)
MTETDHSATALVPANQNFCGGFFGEKVPLVPASFGLGPSLSISVWRFVPAPIISANFTGKKAWSHNFAKSPLFASVTATAGDLVFVGGTNDRNFRAFDAKTGDVLWEQKTNSGIVGMPIAYEVDGTEYIAVQSGWGVDAQRIQDALATSNNVGVEDNVPQGGVVGVFAVGK